MDWRYPLTALELSEEAISASLDALRSNWLTMGPRTQELEESWSAEFGAAHGVAVSSGSAGLHLALQAAGVGPGTEVIVPALSFVADAHAAYWCGGEAAICDVASDEFPLMDARTVEERITENTAAVVAVHMFGYPVDIGPIADLCAERGLALIEDCCESTGAKFPDGAATGSRGAAAVHSFFSKTGTPVGEGGIVLTDDEALADRCRLQRSHAMTSVTWDRHRGHAETYDVTDLGFNYRLDEPRAAMAAAQIPEISSKVDGLRRVVRAYRKNLAEIDGVTPMFDEEHCARSAPFSIPALLADRQARDDARTGLTERRIQTNFYPSLTQLTIYEEKRPCPVADRVADRHLTLPLRASMTDEQVGEVCADLAAVVAGT